MFYIACQRMCLFLLRKSWLIIFIIMWGCGRTYLPLTWYIPPEPTIPAQSENVHIGIGIGNWPGQYGGEYGYYGRLFANYHLAGKVGLLAFNIEGWQGIYNYNYPEQQVYNRLIHPYGGSINLMGDIAPKISSNFRLGVGAYAGFGLEKYLFYPYLNTSVRESFFAPKFGFSLIMAIALSQNSLLMIKYHIGLPGGLVFGLSLNKFQIKLSSQLLQTLYGNPNAYFSISYAIFSNNSNHTGKN